MRGHRGKLIIGSLILRRVVAFGTVIDEVACLVLPRVGPLIVERNDRPRGFNGLEQAQRITYQRFLLIGLIGASRSVAERKIGIGGARRIC